MLISPTAHAQDASVSARFAAGYDGADAFEGERRTLQLVGILGDLCGGSQDGNGTWDEESAVGMVQAHRRHNWVVLRSDGVGWGWEGAAGQGWVWFGNSGCKRW